MNREIIDLAETLLEALEDERKEVVLLIREIEYIPERFDRMADVAKGIIAELKESKNG
jgi:hypothetical protein